MRLFLPSPRETNLLILLGCAALGYALYLRHSVVAAPELATACAAGLPRAICSLRRIMIELGEMQFFGGLALVASVVQFVRPRVAAFATGLVAAVFGLNLANTELAALAAGILVISLARPARTSTPPPGPAMLPTARAPASSGTSR